MVIYALVDNPHRGNHQQLKAAVDMNHALGLDIEAQMRCVSRLIINGFTVGRHVYGIGDGKHRKTGD